MVRTRRAITVFATEAIEVMADERVRMFRKRLFATPGIKLVDPALDEGRLQAIIRIMKHGRCYPVTAPASSTLVLVLDGHPCDAREDGRVSVRPCSSAEQMWVETRAFLECIARKAGPLEP